MVEFAVVLPILLLILLSMIDFGRYFYVRISLSSASFEIADSVSRGLLSSSDDANQKTSKLNLIVNDVAPGIAAFAQLQSAANLNFTPLPSACPSTSGLVTVNLSTTFNSISPLSNFFTEASSSTTMRCLR